MSRLQEIMRGEIAIRRSMLKASGSLSARRRPPKQQEPTAAKTRYFAALRGIVEFLKSEVDREVLPLLPSLATKQDALNVDASQLTRLGVLLEGIASKFTTRFTRSRLVEISQEYARATSDFHKQQLAKQARAVLGIEINFSDRQLVEKIEAFTANNVALIRSMATDYLGAVEKQVIAGVRAGARHEAIAIELQERFSVSESKAALIARDQVGKFYGELNEMRQTEAGITSYTWRTSQDERVREEHVERNGQTFTWDNPPEDGHPGEAINCRCHAEPDLKELLGSK